MTTNIPKVDKNNSELGLILSMLADLQVQMAAPTATEASDPKLVEAVKYVGGVALATNKKSVETGQSVAELRGIMTEGIAKIEQYLIAMTAQKSGNAPKPDNDFKARLGQFDTQLRTQTELIKSMIEKIESQPADVTLPESQSPVEERNTQPTLMPGVADSVKAMNFQSVMGRIRTYSTVVEEVTLENRKFFVATLKQGGDWYLLPLAGDDSAREAVYDFARTRAQRNGLTGKQIPLEILQKQVWALVVGDVLPSELMDVNGRSSLGKLARQETIWVSDQKYIETMLRQINALIEALAAKTIL